jgi:hypothetical protein
MHILISDFFEEDDYVFIILSLKVQVALDLTEDEKHQIQNMVVEEGG